MKKLRRKKRDRMLGGVCAGLADYFEIDVSLVRLAMVLFALLEGVGILFYILAWIVIPEEQEEKPHEKPEGPPQELSPEDTSGEELKRCSKSGEDMSGPKILGGIILILLGILLLIRNFVVWIPFSKIWPVFLILIGVWVLIKSFQREE